MQTIHTLRQLLLYAATMMSISLCGGFARAQATPEGVWKTQLDQKDRALVRISNDNGIYVGTIERILDISIKKDAVCEACTDERKGKPLVGMNIIKSVRESRKEKMVWEGGEILDPNNGKTYKIKLTLTSEGRVLLVRAFASTPLLGKTQHWVRME
jgi:uncharacterized protein (DUF2147 family)